MNRISYKNSLECFSDKEISRLKSLGIEISEKTNEIIKVNYNIIAEYLIKKKIKLLITQGRRFYKYNNQRWVWEAFKDLKLERWLYNFLDKLTKKQWTQEMETGIVNVLKRISKMKEKLNIAKDYLNVTNGMVNIHTKQLTPHKRSFYSTVQIPITFDPIADCPLFKKVLNDIFEGDPERINVFQEIFGDMLFPEIKTQRAYFFLGAGSNGKSLLIKVIEYILGKENISSVPLEEFKRPFSRGTMVDKLANISVETEVSKRCIEASHFKAITTGDSVLVENKFEKPFSIVLPIKLLFAMNTLPNSQDKTYGYLRRFFILPFKRIFKPEEADRDLFDKLIPEMPGILNFALDGLARLSKNDFKFTPCTAVEEAITDYKTDQNPLYEFVDTNLKVTKDPNIKLKTDEIWSRFKLWCRSNKNESFYKNMKTNPRYFWSDFRNVAADLGVAIPSRLKKSNGKTYITNFTLRKIKVPQRDNDFV